MNPAEKSLINRLEACIQEEIGAQKRLLALLQEQERAIVEMDAHALSASGKRLDEELASGATREHLRKSLLNGLIRQGAVPRSSLTLSSICERAGDEAKNLGELRDGLRAVTAAVLKKGRKIATLASYHRGLFEEVVQVLAGGGAEGTGEDGGVLVDAEA